MSPPSANRVQQVGRVGVGQGHRGPPRLSLVVQPKIPGGPPRVVDPRLLHHLRARQQIERMAALADQLGQRLPRCTTAYFQGWRALLAGRLHEAKVLYEQAGDIGRQMTEFELVALATSARPKLGLHEG